jgi:hypothetical protein
MSAACPTILFVMCMIAPRVVSSAGHAITGDFIGTLASGIQDAVSWIFTNTATLWLRIPSPDLANEPAITAMRQWLLPITAAVAVGGMLAAGLRMVLTRRANPLLDVGTGLAAIAVDVRQRSVLAGEGRGDVDVVDPGAGQALADCYPADPVRVVVRGQSHLVHELGGDRVPLGVGESPVGRGCAERTVPDRAGLVAAVDRIQRRVQQAGQTAEIACAIWSRWRFERPDRVAPPGHQVRVLVLVSFPRPVKVIQQAGSETALHDAGYHGRCRLILSTTSSMRSTTAAAYRAYWMRFPGG